MKEKAYELVLSPQELKEWLDYTKKSNQIDVLQRRGIPFMISDKGNIKVAREVFNKFMGINNKSIDAPRKRTEPNYEALLNYQRNNRKN